MPSAPPSSELVSEIADAAPARSTGALPTMLGAAGLEIRTQGRHRQVQDGEVHGVEHAGEGNHRETDPFAAPGAGSLALLGMRIIVLRLRPLRPLRPFHRPALTISTTAARAQTTPLTCQLLRRSRSTIRASSTVLAG